MVLIKLFFWALVGGVIAFRFQIPGGAFIGALLACAFYRILSPQPTDLPVAMSLSIQILAGVLVGSSFDPLLVRKLKHLLPWALAGAVIYLGVGILLARLFTMLGVLEPKTALYSLTPGALLGMSVISTAEGAQPGVVAMFHMVRMILVLVFAPLIAHIMLR